MRACSRVGRDVPADRPREQRIRSASLLVRLTEAEREQVRAAAKRDDRTVSQWVRLALMRAVKRQAPKGRGKEGRR